MRLAPEVLRVVTAYAAVAPVPQGAAGTIDDACRVWTERLCQTVRFHFPEGLPGVGGTFGWKRASDSRPPSKETLALQVGSALHGWDLLIGVGTGTPTLSPDPAYHDLIAEGPQVFLPVPPVDHLAVTATGHAALSTPLWGLSAFDLCAALASGDRSYYDAVVRPSGLVPRVIVASIWDGGGSGRWGRTMAEGRAQLAVALAQWAADGVRSEVTLLCDTGEYATRDGLTRDAALAHVAACNALLLAAPTAVAGVRLGNENSHSVEAAFMADGAFLREAAALVDRRFPLSFGAGHGGEVILPGGSYISHHSDRGQTPEANAVGMADAQRQWQAPVVDGEPLGITEPDRVAGRQRTSDADYARRLATAAIGAGLGGVTLHLDSGIGCRLDQHGAVHQAAVAAFLAVVGVAAPVTPVDPLTDLGERAARSAIALAYRRLLGRAPDPDGERQYLARLRMGLTVPQMEAELRASEEYRARGGA